MDVDVGGLNGIDRAEGVRSNVVQVERLATLHGDSGEGFTRVDENGDIPRVNHLLCTYIQYIIIYIYII